MPIKVKEQPVVRKYMDINEHETIRSITYIKIKDQLVVITNMDVNENERLSNIITLRHTCT